MSDDNNRGLKETYHHDQDHAGLFNLFQTNKGWKSCFPTNKIVENTVLVELTWCLIVPSLTCFLIRLRVQSKMQWLRFLFLLRAEFTTDLKDPKKPITKRKDLKEAAIGIIFHCKPLDWTKNNDSVHCKFQEIS